MEIRIITFLLCFLLAVGTGQETPVSESCFNNCGNSVGKCSCTSSCTDDGNCCDDYRDYCMTSPTQEQSQPWPTEVFSTVPPTIYESCRNNCGLGSGSCSCASYCHYLENCCHDFDYYCFQTTTPPPIWLTTTTTLPQPPYWVDTTTTPWPTTTTVPWPPYYVGPTTTPQPTTTTAPWPPYWVGPTTTPQPTTATTMTPWPPVWEYTTTTPQPTTTTMAPWPTTTLTWPTTTTTTIPPWPSTWIDTTTTLQPTTATTMPPWPPFWVGPTTTPQPTTTMTPWPPVWVDTTTTPQPTTTMAPWPPVWVDTTTTPQPTTTTTTMAPWTTTTLPWPTTTTTIPPWPSTWIDTTTTPRPTTATTMPPWPPFWVGTTTTTPQPTTTTPQPTTTTPQPTTTMAPWPPYWVGPTTTPQPTTITTTLPWPTTTLPWPTTTTTIPPWPSTWIDTTTLQPTTATTTLPWPTTTTTPPQPPPWIIPNTTLPQPPPWPTKTLPKTPLWIITTTPQPPEFPTTPPPPQPPVWPTTQGIYSECGGNLFGAGSFSSPYYPGNYQNNAHCVWYISAPPGQQVYLKIIDKELENCCSCDYIEVFDGQSLSSRSLGRVCQTTAMYDFHSTSSYLTVLFRSDGSVVRRGFRADYTSSLPDNAGRVDCSSGSMNIVIQTSYLNSMGDSGYDLYVNDQDCRPTVSSSQVVFSFELNACGTKREFNNGRIVYTNGVRAYPSQSGEITRQSHFTLQVLCRMEQDATAQIMYVVREAEAGNFTGSGRFNITMAFYASSNFIYPVYNSPYVVNLNQYLYVQVKLRRPDSSLVLFLDTCVASPSPHNFKTRSYDLVRNGCRRDSTYYEYSSGRREVAQFRFQAFEFLRSNPEVYLQCTVTICRAQDNTSRCSQGCRMRKARSLRSAADSETATVILGPIQLRDIKKPRGETS